MTKAIDDNCTFIDDNATKRFNSKRSKNFDTIKILAENNPKKIIKLDSEQRIKERENRLAQQRSPDLTIERIITGNDLMPVFYFEKGRKTADSICRIEIMDGNGNVMGHGTGFMVSSSLLMTNNHVLTSKEDCKNSIAQFNYEKSEDLFDKQHISFRLEPDKFFYTNEKLDFSLVYVSPTSSSSDPLTDFRHLKLIKQIGKAVIGEYVSIIQHPRGKHKQVAIRENRVIDLLDDFIHYVTDTDPGSSGSPVFNDQWEVVSLHHSGVPKTDENGNYLTKDGQIWTENMGEDQIAWIGNEGVRISSIVKDLENQLSTIAAEQKPVLEELLKLTK
jgi:V8-like Glu-specific endopeptidase